MRPSIPDQNGMRSGGGQSSSMGDWAPGDSVWVKDWKKELLIPWWTGPHTVILTTPTAPKTSGITPWVHHSTVKKSNSEGPTTWRSDPDPVIPLKPTLKRELTPEVSSPAPATPREMDGLHTAEA